VISKNAKAAYIVMPNINRSDWLTVKANLAAFALIGFLAGRLLFLIIKEIRSSETIRSMFFLRRRQLTRMKALLNQPGFFCYHYCMDAKLNKNSGQMLKAFNDALMLKQKSGNDPLQQVRTNSDTQTQRLEQTDLRAVAIMLSTEAKEKLRDSKRKKPKEQKKQQKK